MHATNASLTPHTERMPRSFLSSLFPKSFRFVSRSAIKINAPSTRSVASRYARGSFSRAQHPTRPPSHPPPRASPPAVQDYRRGPWGRRSGSSCGCGGLSWVTTSRSWASAPTTGVDLRDLGLWVHGCGWSPLSSPTLRLSIVSWRRIRRRLRWSHRPRRGIGGGRPISPTARPDRRRGLVCLEDLRPSFPIRRAGKEAG